MSEPFQRAPMPPSMTPFYFLLAVVLTLFMLFVSKAFAAEVRTVRLSDERVAEIRVSSRGTVLSFPIRPTKVILGKQQAFGIEYVENDLAITPLGGAVRSHLFVYLYGRRFTFDLIGGGETGAAIIQVRDLADAPPQKTGKTTSRRAITATRSLPKK